MNDQAPDEAVATPFDRLRAGNVRFLDAIAASADADAAVAALAVAEPYAIVLGCADSRVPPELIFDESIGRLFVVRVAAHVAASEEIGTIEYAVARWNCPLLVVLGHTQCAAIAAAMEPPPPGAEPSPNLTGSMHLPLLLGSIRAGLGLVRSDASADPWGDAVRVNVRRTISQISLWSMPIRGRVEAGRLAIVGAVYDVQTGEVKFLNR